PAAGRGPVRPARPGRPGHRDPGRGPPHHARPARRARRGAADAAGRLGPFDTARVEPSQADGQAECGEHRWLLERGDVGQAAVFKAQHAEHEREKHSLAGTAEVPGRAGRTPGKGEISGRIAGPRAGEFSGPVRLYVLLDVLESEHLGDGMSTVIM